MNVPLQKQTRLLLSLAALLSAGCSSNEVKPDAARVPASKTPTSSATIEGLFAKSENLRPVYFPSGGWELNTGTMQMLKENVDWLKKNMPLHILVAGYSDGQGTPEQNLSMGQRRASALRDFYVSMGIPRSRMSTVTYGQEEPVCFEATEECQAQNRRVETLIENKAFAHGS